MLIMNGLIGQVNNRGVIVCQRIIAFIGIEGEPKYFNIAKERLENEY